MPIGGGGIGFGGVGGVGGGGATVPSNIVVGSSLSTSNIEIDGLSGSPDQKPASPSANNDEFNENTSGTPTGWTVFQPVSAITVDTNTVKSQLHLAGPGDSKNRWAGIYKAIPTFPFTVTAKVSDMSLLATVAAGIFVSGGIPGGVAVPFALQFTTQDPSGSAPSTANAQIFTQYDTFGSSLGSALTYVGSPMYLRMIVTSATSITYEASPNGLVWTVLHSAANPGFTPTNVGLTVSTQGAASEAMFDWIRFT